MNIIQIDWINEAVLFVGLFTSFDTSWKIRSGFLHSFKKAEPCNSKFKYRLTSVWLMITGCRWWISLILSLASSVIKQNWSSS